MGLFSELYAVKQYPIFNDKTFYFFVMVMLVSLFTVAAEIYYFYVHGASYTRCTIMNNNDRSKCVSKSDMRNFLYNKLIS